MDSKKIHRMNQLAKKELTEGLTPVEIAEQKLLRVEYLSKFKKNIKSTLEDVLEEFPEK